MQTASCFPNKNKPAQNESAWHDVDRRAPADFFDFYQRADYPEEPPIWLQAVIMASVVVEICTALWLLGPA